MIPNMRVGVYIPPLNFNRFREIIVQVLPIEQTFGYEEGIEEKWDKMGIKFFKTYVGAAVMVCCVSLGQDFGFNYSLGADWV